MEKWISLFLILINSAFLSMAQMEGDLRLVGMNSSHRGRVELFHDGKWGTLCNNDYGHVSRVICYQLNFTSSSPASHHGRSVKNLEKKDQDLLSKYSENQTIHFWDIDCGPVYSNPPSTIHLLRCEYEELDESIDCTHEDDLVVFCDNNASHAATPYQTQVRLVKKEDQEPEGNTSVSTGTLEIFLKSAWGNICHTNFSKEDGNTACRQLGYTSAQVYEEPEKTTDTIWLNDIDCNTSNSCLNECFEPENVVKQSSCENDLYVGLTCHFDMPVNVDSGNPIKCNYTKRYSKVPAYFIGIMGGAFIEWVITVVTIIITAVCLTKETCPGYKYRIRLNKYVVID